MPDDMLELGFDLRCLHSELLSKWHLTGSRLSIANNTIRNDLLVKDRGAPAQCNSGHCFENPSIPFSILSGLDSADPFP